MTTVNVTSTVVSAYDWSDSGFDWTGVEAGKTWEKFGTLDYAAAIGESLAAAESFSKTVGLNVGEAIAIADAHAFAVGMLMAEGFSIEEAAERVADFTRAFAETVTVLESLAKDVGLEVADSITLVDTVKKAFGLAFADGASVSDDLASSMQFVRNFAETIDVTEAIGKDIGKPFAESLRIVDLYLRGVANAVMSALKVKSTPISKADFDRALKDGADAGFANFRTFLPGDYSLQRALVRVVLEATTSDRTRLKTLKHTIDVPDVHDRGQVTSSASGVVHVAFNRAYTNPPDITATLRGGTVYGVPTVTNVTETGFDFELLNSSGTRVVGTCSWASLGY